MLGTTMNPTLQEILDLMARIGRPVQLMEVCGTHTMAIFRTGLRALLPESLRLLSGPGCPVCVTHDRFLEHALAIAAAPGTLITTFGDMLRVPGRSGSLETARANGANVQVVYSPLDALATARQHPELRVVFLGIGFETTAPATAGALLEAARTGVTNFMVLSAHKTIPNALAALLNSGEVKIDGFLMPGHVSVITGTHIYDVVASDFQRPAVVTGFEAEEILAGIALTLRMIAAGHPEVGNAYGHTVTAEGNRKARELLREVFEPCDDVWRGLGLIPGSGLQIRPAFAAHDAARAFPAPDAPVPETSRGCRCGDVLRGVITPPQCPLFRNVCTPWSPQGACMVSSEGTCAAYFRFS
jgi:hydrogenase expression/formation protein HypD